MAEQRRKVVIAVNGRTYEREVDVRLSLADFLRHELGLTGTHVGCEHGVCGACTVLVDGQSARSCLMLGGAGDRATPSRRSKASPARSRCIRCRRRSGSITRCSAASVRPAC